MNIREIASDMGRIHYPFANSDHFGGVVVEKVGRPHESDYQAPNTGTQLNTKSVEQYNKRFDRFQELMDGGMDIAEIAIEMQLSLPTLKGKNYLRRYLVNKID